MLTAKELSAIEEQLKAEKLLITKIKRMPNYVMIPNSEKMRTKWPQNMRIIIKPYYHYWIKGYV